MKRVITYGTFDLFHQGHWNLLKRAKDLGDYLIVGVTSDAYDIERGKLNVHDSVLERIESVRSTGLVDEVIVEEYEGQKILDVQSLDIDVFAIGSDWKGQFDYLNEYCEVVYLDRTQGVSSTQLREGEAGPVRIGVVGALGAASALVTEARYVSGTDVVGVFDSDQASAVALHQAYEMDFVAASYDELLQAVDAVFLADCLDTYERCCEALKAGKHVLCDGVLGCTAKETQELYALADEHSVVLLEGVVSAYSPGFMHLPPLAKSGRIGRIVGVDISLTMPSFSLLPLDGAHEGALDTLVAYTLFAASKLAGTNPSDITFSHGGGVDSSLMRMMLTYSDITASIRVSADVLTLSSLVITGTRGYIYVPDPWWKTSYYEVRHQAREEKRRYYYAFDGDGVRYELHEFVKMIREHRSESQFFTRGDSAFIADVLERFHTYAEEIRLEA